MFILVLNDDLTSITEDNIKVDYECQNSDSDENEHLKPSSTLEDTVGDDSNNCKYEIVELLDDEQSPNFEMIYCDNVIKNNKDMKKQKSFRCMFDGCEKTYASSYQLNVDINS